MTPTQCDACSKRFSWLKKKRTCSMCRSYYCSECMQRARYFSVGRYCLRCVRLGGVRYERSTLQQMPVRDLKHIMKIFNVSSVFCREKSDLIEQILLRDDALHPPPSAPPPPRVVSPTIVRQQPLRNSSQDSIRVRPYESIRVRPVYGPVQEGPPAPEHDLASTPVLQECDPCSPDGTAAARPAVRRRSSDDSDDDDVGEFIVVDDEPVRTAAADDAGGDAERRADHDSEVVAMESESTRTNPDTEPDGIGEAVQSQRIPTVQGGANTGLHETVLLDSDDDECAENTAMHGLEPEDDSVIVVNVEAEESVIIVEEDEEDVVEVERMSSGELPPVEEMETREKPLPRLDLSNVSDVAELPSEECVDLLTVRQCKQMLQRRRTEYRDVIEKQELVRRVRQLWRETTRNAQDLARASDLEICKICMDAVIDCVMLECGHMATCTSCGKQMSECPICRQYVVRVVHVFRS